MSEYYRHYTEKLYITRVWNHIVGDQGLTLDNVIIPDGNPWRLLKLMIIKNITIKYNKN
jgi:hypothetical protein